MPGGRLTKNQVEQKFNDTIKNSAIPGFYLESAVFNSHTYVKHNRACLNLHYFLSKRYLLSKEPLFTIKSTLMKLVVHLQLYYDCWKEVILMFTLAEKERLINTMPQLLKRITKNDGADLLINLLSAYIEKTSDGKRIDIYRSEKNSVERLEEILSYMAEVAVAEEENHKYYTTGELSKYFGVSITTINNWVNEGRFVSVERRKQHEQLKVRDDVKWKARNGETFLVSDIVLEWEGEQKAVGLNLYDYDEKAFLQNQIILYEKKYLGSYESTLGHKENWTAEEQTDATSWNYFRKKLGHE